MSNEENKNEEIVEEVKEETNENACECGCESCNHDDCDCEECLGDYTFEPIHKRFSCANVFSIVAKAIAVLYLILGTYSYVLEVINYYEMYGEHPLVVDVILGFFSSIFLLPLIFWAVGEIVNLLNRVKEAIMY